jgi:hypothetical protein
MYPDKACIRIETKNEVLSNNRQKVLNISLYGIINTPFTSRKGEIDTIVFYIDVAANAWSKIP